MGERGPHTYPESLETYKIADGSRNFGDAIAGKLKNRVRDCLAFDPRRDSEHIQPNTAAS